MSISTVHTQNVSPDKFINAIKKEDSAFAFTVPGWLIRSGGRIAMNDDDMDYREREMIGELTSHIKKLRFVVSETLPQNFEQKLQGLRNYMDKHNYESLIAVRDEGSNVNLWARFDGDIIERLVIAVIGDGEETAVFNIKSDLDMNSLKKMDFFQEWSSL